MVKRNAGAVILKMTYGYDVKEGQDEVVQTIEDAMDAFAISGVPGTFLDPDFNGVHGLNERIRVESLYAARDYLYDLAKAYAG